VDCPGHVTGECQSKPPDSTPQAPHSQTSLNWSKTGQQDPIQLCFHNRDGKDLGSLVPVHFLLRGVLLRFLLTNKSCFALVVGGEGFHDNWDLGSQEGDPHL